MPVLNTISITNLARLIGTPAAPIVIDVRTDEDYDADPRLLPTSLRRSHSNIEHWAPQFKGQTDASSVLLPAREALTRMGVRRAPCFNALIV